MKVKFECTYEEYKKYLYKSGRKINIILFIVGIASYLFFTHNKVSLIYLPLAILALLLLIYLLNILYVKSTIRVNEMLSYNMYGKYILELTPNKFSVTLNNKKTDYKYKQIRKVVEKKDEFRLKLDKGREFLLFEKKFFTEDEYVKIINMFKEKSQI